jgi:hypothetical protein
MQTRIAARHASCSTAGMWKLFRRSTRNAPPDGPGVHDQVLFGAGVGMACGGTFAILLGGSGALVAFGAVLGIATGFVWGLLAWIGSAALPEEAILAVPRRRTRAVAVRSPRA